MQIFFYETTKGKYTGLVYPEEGIFLQKVFDTVIMTARTLAPAKRNNCGRWCVPVSVNEDGIALVEFDRTMPTRREFEKEVSDAGRLWQYKVSE